jgi:toluene monooxygenase system ferredoxin subunit
MMAYQKAVSFDELWSGEMTAREVAGRAVLLVRLGADVFAYEDRCAHLGVPLSEGCLADGLLTCSAHHWQYDVRTGAGVNPASARLRALGVKLEDGDVLVDVERTGR